MIFVCCPSLQLLGNSMIVKVRFSRCLDQGDHTVCISSWILFAFRHGQETRLYKEVLRHRKAEALWSEARPGEEHGIVLQDVRAAFGGFDGRGRRAGGVSSWGLSCDNDSHPCTHSLLVSTFIYVHVHPVLSMSIQFYPCPSIC